MKKIIVVLFIAMVQGCSNGTPSHSEIVAAVKSYYPVNNLDRCPGVTVENIKKQNGIKIDDADYRIVASYDVRVIPVRGYQDKINDLKSKQSDLSKERQSLNDEIVRIARENGDQYSNFITLTENPEQAPQQMVPSLQRIKENEKAQNEVYTRLNQTVEELSNKWGSADCAFSISSVFGFDRSKAFATGEVRSYSRTFNMIKTDNGWMASR